MANALSAHFIKRFDRATIEGELEIPMHVQRVTVLFGPSGCGKTTVLRCLAGLEVPDEGTIRFGAETWLDKQRGVCLTPQERGIGFVFQNYALFPHLSVAANVGYGLNDLNASERKRRVRELLDRFELTAQADQRPHQLSGGQQQRVGLARSLAMDPPLLLMDEPFGALDPVLRHQLQQEFLGIRKQLNKTILFVTHDVEEAFRLGDRVGVVAEGKLIRVGTPEDLIMNPGSSAVASLIGVEQKMRYLDHLSVKSMMIPIDPSRILDGNLFIDDAREALIASRADYIIVGREGVVEGIFYPHDLLTAGGTDIRLGGQAHKLPVFPSSTMASEALSAMKRQGVSIAVISEPDGTGGLLVMDEIMRRLL